MTVMSHVFPTQVVRITKETKGKNGIVYTDEGGGLYVCTKGLLVLRFSMSEASGGVLLQHGVHILFIKIHLDMRFPVFQRFQQLSTQNPQGSCIFT